LDLTYVNVKLNLQQCTIHLVSEYGRRPLRSPLIYR